jgi:hypothetical protein
VGLLAFIGTLMTGQLAAAAAAEEPPRSTLAWTTDGACVGVEPSVAFLYQDVTDGHTPQTFHATLYENDTDVYSDDQTLVGFTEPGVDDGDLRWTFASDDVGIAFENTYTFELTVTFDDGVAEELETIFRPGDAVCVPGSPTSGPPSTLPETGNGPATWLIGVLAGLLLAAGSVLVAGA